MDRNADHDVLSRGSMRLKSEVWVKAFLRRCAYEGAAAAVVRHGDDDAGAIYIKINSLNGHAMLFGPAPAGLDEAASGRQWVPCLPCNNTPEANVDARLSKELDFDPDIWVIEVEDRLGRHFLDGWLAPESK